MQLVPRTSLPWWLLTWLLLMALHVQSASAPPRRARQQQSAALQRCEDVARRASMKAAYDPFRSLQALLDQLVRLPPWPPNRWLDAAPRSIVSAAQTHLLAPGTPQVGWTSASVRARARPRRVRKGFRTASFRLASDRFPTESPGSAGPKERDVKNPVHTRFTLFNPRMPTRLPPGFLYSPTAILADSNL